MKTPEEIKKGLLVCGASSVCKEQTVYHCEDCPYYEYQTGDVCIPEVTHDALAYIQQLERIVANSMLEAPHLRDFTSEESSIKIDNAKVWLKKPERFTFITRHKLVLFDYIFFVISNICCFIFTR